jgi:protein-S-isoprenylcysteine O-methyltransferase Ste14
MMNRKKILAPATWFFYLVIVCEILFMISPFALHFYSAYGPTLNFLHRSPSTAWLSKFFLPHFSATTSPLLNALPKLAGLLVLLGLVIFLAGAIPLYWAKLRGRGPVSGGLYAFIRHPQYAGLSILGLGTLLIWPRFLVLITYITVLFLYYILAGWEEEQCLTRFGERYRTYQEQTGMFLPQIRSGKKPRILSTSRDKRILINIGIFVIVIVAAIVLAFGLRDYSLSKISASYTKDVAIVSPAILTDQELSKAYRLGVSDSKVHKIIDTSDPAKFIVYIVPQEWRLPDLPIERQPGSGGHYAPKDFDRRHYKILFTKAQTYAEDAQGKDIMKAAYAREAIVVVKIDVSASKVTGIETPPPHVRWGDIPTPMF